MLDRKRRMLIMLEHRQREFGVYREVPKFLEQNISAKDLWMSEKMEIKELDTMLHDQVEHPSPRRVHKSLGRVLATEKHALLDSHYM